MGYKDVIGNVRYGTYSQQELEYFGLRLCRQLFRHIEMVRYSSHDLKEFDLSIKELSELSDIASHIVLGIDEYRGVEGYVGKVHEFLERVGELSGKRGTNSVKADLKVSVLNETRNLINNVGNANTRWNIKNRGK